MTDKEIIRAEIEKAYNEAQNRVKLVKDVYWEGKVDAYRNVLCVFDLMQEEPAHCTGIGEPKEESGVLGEMIKEMDEEPKDHCEEPVSEELEEAARADAMVERSDDTEVGYDLNRYGGFIAGAKWQKKIMEKECGNLQKGLVCAKGVIVSMAYEQGKIDMKQQMSKHIVLETKVVEDSDGDGVDTEYEHWLTLENTEIQVIPDNIGLKDGDKVKLYIFKED